jgi:hypothetical protein
MAFFSPLDVPLPAVFLPFLLFFLVTYYAAEIEEVNMTCDDVNAVGLSICLLTLLFGRMILFEYLWEIP